jgi:hypothetical protein
MTSTELEKQIRQRLQAAGLLSALDEHKSQFLEFPEGFFVELVLNDGARLVDVEGIVRELNESLRKQGVELNSIVRANWVVETIGNPGPAVSVSGGIRSAWAFPVTLVSGSAKTDVEIDVTQLAIQEIKGKVADGSLGAMDEKLAMQEIVREFLKLHLSLGGESYWDPIRYPKQDLNDSALLYLWMHNPVGKR